MDNDQNATAELVSGVRLPGGRSYAKVRCACGYFNKFNLWSWAGCGRHCCKHCGTAINYRQVRYKAPEP